MHLRHVSLRDWKAFVASRFDFPPPTDGQNVILIGALNGYGKTSLFEAVVLGLFGRDGLPLIARAPFSSGDEARLQTSYNDFLSGVLHKRALEEGRSSCSVELGFDDPEEGPLLLRRIWHFSSSGRHRPQDEEVRIYEGSQEIPVRVPPSERANENEWYRGYIARRFLPYNLAGFFLFDGEQVQDLAKRDMSIQVRRGIEGLLGIPILKELAEDLRSYAANRRTGQGAASDQTIRRIQTELDGLVAQRDDQKARLDQLNPELDRLIEEREALTRELGGGWNGSEALLRENYEELNRLKKARDEQWDAFAERLADDFSLALGGPELRESVIATLNAEEIREGWESGRNQVERNLSSFLAALTTSLSEVKPPLTGEQSAGVLERVRVGLERLWHPPPDGCAAEYKHPYLRGGDRAQARGRLEEINKVTSGDIAEALSAINELEAKIRKLQAQIAEVQGIGPQLEEKTKRLRTLIAQVDEKTREKGRLDREVEALEAQVNAKRQELGRYVQSRAAAEPALRRAARADQFADLVDAIAREAVPGQIAAVAEGMTKAYTAMAHKTLVEKVVIDEDCNVQLLTRSGRNLRELDSSAGEQQIFAQALIAAIAQVSGRNFPILVDTPLARLDRDHRLGVLKYFTDRKGQVILLSTNTEVIGRYYEAVKPRVAAEYRIESEHDGDIAKSWPVQGYFS